MRPLCSLGRACGVSGARWFRHSVWWELSCVNSDQLPSFFSPFHTGVGALFAASSLSSAGLFGAVRPRCRHRRPVAFHLGRLVWGCCYSPSAGQPAKRPASPLRCCSPRLRRSSTSESSYVSLRESAQVRPGLGLLHERGQGVRGDPSLDTLGRPHTRLLPTLHGGVQWSQIRLRLSSLHVFSK